ncbi:MAG: DUF4421 family protein, partial [Bacteroidales bacterium]|nr:DUF4421 family protein [Bacteroidales bacterium]MBN2756037.1 DUF4421 family protein [Bacteroidales bacterium]
LDLTQKLGLHINTITKYHNINLTNLETKDKLKIQPNGQTNIGFGFNYKWLGLGASFSMPFMNKDDEKYGETSRFDTQLNIFSKWFGVDAHLQYYKGFYLSNPDDFQEWEEEYYPQINDIESMSLGISTYYFFNNRNFSYKAAFIRNQIQKKSAGAFILGGFYKLNIVVAPSGFVPVELNDTLKPYFDISAYSSGIIGVSIGYTYTLVLFKNFFANASLVPGLGVRVVKLWADNSEYNLDPSLSSSVTIRLAMGYEGKRFYWGFNAITSIDSYQHETMEISSSTGNIKFFVGKRFNFSLKRKNKD